MRTLILLMLPLLALAEPMEVAARDGANLQRPVWSADGAQLAYEANFHEAKKVELYVGDPAAKRFQRISPASSGVSSMTAGFSTTSSGGSVAHELTWSPPGIGRFIYAGTNEMGDFDLYIAGGGAIAAHPGADGGAAWSPDGKWIAFTSARTGQGDVYLIDVASIEKPPRQITSDKTSAELYLAWSDHGGKLAWVGHSGTTGDNIWLLPALDDTPIKLTSMTGSQSRPSFSPNGNLVAFYATGADSKDRWDLYVTTAQSDSKPTRILQSVVPNATGPAWHPSGDALVTVLDDDQRFDPIVTVPVDGGDPTVVELGTVGHGDIDVAQGKDGKARIAYVAQGRVTDTTRAFKKLYVAQLP